MAIERIEHTGQRRKVGVKRHLFTLEEFERLVESGGFDEDTRVELIGGEILDMAPINFPHEMCVARLTKLLERMAGDAALIWPQNNSIRLPPNSRPEPDVTLLRLRDYSSDKPPRGEDVLLVIEVAESSIGHDRKKKGPLYAQAGIAEYWIVNLRSNVVEVYSEPVEGAYKQVRQVRRGEVLALPGGLGSVLEVSDILPEK